MEVDMETSIHVDLEVLRKVTKRLYDISVISDKLYSDFNENLDANHHRSIMNFFLEVVVSKITNVDSLHRVSCAATIYDRLVKERIAESQAVSGMYCNA
jgi:hypothetical protein